MCVLGFTVFFYHLLQPWPRGQMSRNAEAKNPDAPFGRIIGRVSFHGWFFLFTGKPQIFHGENHGFIWENPIFHGNSMVKSLEKPVFHGKNPWVSGEKKIPWKPIQWQEVKTNIGASNLPRWLPRLKRFKRWLCQKKMTCVDLVAHPT